MRPEPAAPALSRRGFLAALGAVPATLLGGCAIAPGSRWWDAVAWAERLNALVARPFAGARAKVYPASAATADFPVRSLTLPTGYAEGLDAWALEVAGLVAKPGRFDLATLRRGFPRVAEATRHDCVEGWSAIAEWTGLPLHALLAAVEPLPAARWVVFHSADFDERTQAPYYGSLALADAHHPQTLLAYAMNGEPLPLDHGAPLRLKVPTQLGYKSTKFIHRITLVSTLEGLGGGKGGYWEDAGYEHWAGI